LIAAGFMLVLVAATTAMALLLLDRRDHGFDHD
jgi:hypothetical protein